MRFFTQLEECHHRPADLPRTAGVGQFKRPCDLLWFPLLRVPRETMTLTGPRVGWQDFGRLLIALEWKSANTPTEYDSEKDGGRLKDHQAQFLRQADQGAHGRGYVVVNYRGTIQKAGDQEWDLAGLPCSPHTLAATEALEIDRTFAIRMCHWDAAMEALPGRPIRGHRGEHRRPLVNPEFLRAAHAVEIKPMKISDRKDGKTWDFGPLAPKVLDP